MNGGQCKTINNNKYKPSKQYRYKVCKEEKKSDLYLNKWISLCKSAFEPLETLTFSGVKGILTGHGSLWSF